MARAGKLSARRARNMVQYATEHGATAAARRYRITTNAVQYWRKKLAPIIVDGKHVTNDDSQNDHRRVLDAVTLLRKALKVRPPGELTPYDAYVTLALDTLTGGGLR